jgi:hypothetical protein
MQKHFPPSLPLVFPKWANALRPVLGAGLVVAPVYLVLLTAYAVSPKTTDVGYAPLQPVENSHALHAGELGLDCRYCHNTVETSAHAAVPPTQTCMNCHKGISTKSDKIEPLRESYGKGTPIRWRRVHDLPDFVYFDHGAHTSRDVGCVSCHGRVDEMDVMYQAETLSMAWCLDCHRAPEAHLRPPATATQMDYAPKGDPAELGRRLAEELDINPSTDCSTCHR